MRDSIAPATFYSNHLNSKFQLSRITPIGLQLIQHFEGFSAIPYRCPAGYLTIGYGHVIRAGEQWKAITREEASELLAEDVLAAEAAVARWIDVPLSEGQCDALVSFTYNLGAGALQRSGLRRKLNRRDYLAAADEFPRWVWAGGRKLPGLILRREAERARFLGV